MKNADSRTATLIGMATGATEVLLTNPLNFVKFRMQRPEWGYAGMMDAVKVRLSAVRCFQPALILAKVPRHIFMQACMTGTSLPLCCVVTMAARRSTATRV